MREFESKAQVVEILCVNPIKNPEKVKGKKKDIEKVHPNFHFSKGKKGGVMEIYVLKN